MSTFPIHLTKDGGKQHTPEFRAINPQTRVPALVLDSGDVLTQSLAIIEYLDEIHPKPPLLPADPVERAKVRAFAQLIACDIHPLNNLAPLQYLRARAQAGAAGDRRLVSPLGDRGLQRARDDDRARPLCLRRAMSRSPTSVWCRRCQRAAAQGAARRIPEARRGRCRLPEACRPSTRRGRKTSPTPSDGERGACYNAPALHLTATKQPAWPTAISAGSFSG